MRLGATRGDGLPIAAYQGAGIVLSGRMLGAREERIGLAIASAVTSDAFPVPAAGRYRRETGVELTYAAELRRGISIQPNLQYIRHPGADRAERDALAGGIRLRLGWSSAAD